MKTLAPIIAASLLLASTTARAQEQVLQPGGSFEIAPVSADGASPRPPTSIRWKLILGGLFVAGAAWGVGFAMATAWPEVPGSSELKIPVAGPWIALGRSGCARDPVTDRLEDCGAIVYARGVGYVISGLAQIGGIGLIGEGIFQTTQASSKKKPARPAAFTLQPAPLVTGSATGIGIVGTF